MPPGFWNQRSISVFLCSGVYADRLVWGGGCHVHYSHGGTSGNQCMVAYDCCRVADDGNSGHWNEGSGNRQYSVRPADYGTGGIFHGSGSDRRRGPFCCIQSVGRSDYAFYRYRIRNWFFYFRGDGDTEFYQVCQGAEMRRCGRRQLPSFWGIR